MKNYTQFQKFLSSIILFSFILQSCSYSRSDAYDRPITSSRQHYREQRPHNTESATTVNRRVLSREDARDRLAKMLDKRSTSPTHATQTEITQLSKALSQETGIVEIVTPKFSYKVSTQKHKLLGGTGGQLPPEMSKEIDEASSLPRANIPKPNDYVPYKETEPATKPEDMSKLKQLVENTVRASDKTMGKDTVFLMGKTGVGKSLMARYLLGDRIVFGDKDKTSDPSDLNRPPKKFKTDLSEYNKATLDNRPLVVLPSEYDEIFHVNDSYKSVTSVIGVADMDNGLFSIADTPGLKDTKEYLYDIANAIGLERALHNSKSVKFIFLIKESTYPKIEADHLENLFKS